VFSCLSFFYLWLNERCRLLCRRDNIDPQRYLTQLLTNLPAKLINQISQRLPDNWKRRSPTPAG
jgi:hypothetical protein